MRVFVLYRPNSEHDSKVQAFGREFNRQTGHQLELISLDTVEGDHLAELYGVDRYPAIIATDSNGVLQKLWQEDQLPLINEVSYYTTAL